MLDVLVQGCLTRVNPMGCSVALAVGPTGPVEELSWLLLPVVVVVVEANWHTAWLKLASTPRLE